MPRRPRVLFLNSCVSGGGPGRGLALYLREASAALEAHVAMPEPGVIAASLPADVQVHYVREWLERPLRPPYRFMAAVRGLDALGGIAALVLATGKLLRLARRLQPDLIYCNHMLAKPIGAILGWWLGVPVIFHARNIHDQRRLEKWVFQALARVPAVRCIIANSQATAATFLEVVPQKVEVVPNFVDLGAFRRAEVQPTLRAQLGLGPAVPLLGYLGRIAHWKGVGVLLEAFAKVMLRVPSAHLAIVGETDGGSRRDLRREYEAQARQLGIGERVHFLGFRHDVRQVLADFDVLALPSTAPEPFGRVLIEAMALGVPPVITAQGGAMEVVRDGIDGLWAAPRDADDFAAKAAELLTDVAMRQRLGEQAAERARTHFDSQRLAARITQLVQQTAAPSGGIALAHS